MKNLTITTFAWVPELPRGYVRDIRIRWALEEAALPYSLASVPFDERGKQHFVNQPFGQVPWLTDGDETIFESGAILLYLAERAPVLMPSEGAGRTRVIEWIFAALNSVEAASLPWSLYQFADDNTESPGRQLINGFLQSRLQHMDNILMDKEWLVEDFSVADILMADVLRLVDRFGGLDAYPACQRYVNSATTRPAFKKSFADQMGFYEAADKARAE